MAAVVVALVEQLAGGWGNRQPDEVRGTARAIDGDSLVVDGYELRLVGIDAPEGRQTCEREGREWRCGEAAADAIRRFAGRDALTCSVEGRDKHGRLLAVCRVRGRDVNGWMVRNGWAVSYGRYKRDEAKARNGRSGIWSSRFERPRAWRDKNMRGRS